MQTKLPFLVTVIAYLALCSLTLTGSLDTLLPGGLANKPLAILVWTLYTLPIFLALWILRDWKKNASKLLLSGVAALMSLILAELCIRFVHPAGATPTFQMLYSPQLHHVSPPHARMVFESTFFPGPSRIGSKLVEIRTNEIGLRTSYSREQFLRHDIRIVILGDSFAFGAHVEQREAFPEVMERLLRSRLRREDVSVLNAGTVSYSPFLENLLFRLKIREWKPTIVIALLDATDIGDDVQYRRRYTANDKGDLLFAHVENLVLLDKEMPLVSRSALYQRLYFPFTLIRKVASRPLAIIALDPSPSSIQLSIDGVQETSRFFIYKHPPEKTRPYFQATLDNVSRLAEAVTDSGAEMLFVVAPRFQHWNPRECPRNWEASEYGLNEPFQFEYINFFERQKDELGFHVLNLLPAFRQTDRFPLVFEDDPHWNPEGHEFVADVIVAELFARGLIE